MQNDDTLFMCQLGKTVDALENFFLNPNIQHFLISSVVPTMNAKIDALDQSNILFLNHDHFDDLKLYVEPPESIGVDRLVNALAVQKKWNGECCNRRYWVLCNLLSSKDEW